jgi:hypothetical protein
VSPNFLLFAVPGAILVVTGLALLLNLWGAADWYLALALRRRGQWFSPPMPPTTLGAVRRGGVVPVVLGCAFLIAGVTS